MKKVTIKIFMYFLFFMAIMAFIAFLYLNKFFELGKEYEAKKEGFLSGFRHIYRPYVRKVRLYTTNKYKSISNKTYVILRKWGLL